MTQLYEFNGESRTLKEWAAHIGVQYKTLWMRIRDGMPPERAFVADPGRAMKRNPERTVQKTCANCGSTFVIPKCRDWREHCCSSLCKRELMVKKNAADKMVRLRHSATCGGSFLARQWQIDNGIGRFCSIRCSEPARREGRTPEAAAKRGQKRREQYAAGLWKPLSGPANPMWKGGKEAAKARAKPKLAERTRRYRKNNPHKVREFAERRNGRKLGRLPRGTVQRIGSAQRWKCAVCRCDVRDGYHLDHIMPLARGGEHAPNNLQLLCGPCNVRKSAKHPVDFMQSRGFLL